MMEQQILENNFPRLLLNATGAAAKATLREMLQEHVDVYLAKGKKIKFIEPFQRSSEAISKTTVGKKSGWVDKSVPGTGHLHCKGCSEKQGENVYHPINKFQPEFSVRGYRLTCAKPKKSVK